MWLKGRPDCTGKIGATGFCYGGGVSNQLAVRMGDDLAAAVPFYGSPPPVEDVPKIKAAIMAQHGALDKRQVDRWYPYQNAMQAANTTYEGHIYPDSVHGFFNDATPERYNEVAATEAWTRTIDWFNQHVRGDG
jgi:carboxymethylenebutenolidase